ncbi:TPR-like protein [Hesseltinella vesiculosa]|uniref:Protein RRP5 homolog n=1 Tax=Hesseltinella vesiculosa TaxID=101127 RepID=A0A1X2GY09_9FUNG|nr:TPR-like protein [Hesseltinella vesiculosa]
MGKRKTETEATESALTTTEEVNFPRGGASTLTPLEHREISNQVAKDLFSTKKSPKKPTGDEPAKKKRKSNKGKATASEEPKKDQNVMQEFTFNKLSVGSLVLGCVTQINELNLLVSLPCQLNGSVAITEISGPLTSLVELAAEDEDDEIELPSLSDLFYIGQWVHCRVIQLEETKGAKRIELSLKPSVVNENVLKVDVSQGMLIGATVESIEDHGYVMSVGVNGLTAFCKHKDAKSYVEQYNRDESLIVGQYVQCLVNSIPANKRSVQLSMDRDEISKAKVLDPFSTLNSVTPGQKLTGMVQVANKSGLLVKVNGLYDVYINTAQLPYSDQPIDDTYRVSSNVTFRTLFCDVQTDQKFLFGSLLPTLLDLTSPVPSADADDDEAYLGRRYPYGAFIEKITIVRVSKIGVTAVMEGVDNLLGFVHISQLADEQPSLLPQDSGPFAVGTTHRARVLGYKPLDGILSLTLKPSVLEDKYLQFSDIVPGEIVQGTVHKFVANGMLVKLSPRITGYVPLTFLSDATLTRPELKFKIGAKVKPRVMAVEADQRKVILTLKKSLVQSDLPALLNLDDVKPKMATHGVIVSIKPKGSVISFYNNLTAFCPAHEMTEQAAAVKLQDSFRVGQTAKVYVLSVDAENGQLLVSMIRDQVSDAKRPSKKDQTQPRYTPGDIIKDAKIDHIKPMQLVLTLPNNVPGHVHITNAFTSKALRKLKDQKQPLSSFKAGQTVQVKILASHETKKSNYLPLTHKDRLGSFVDCSLILDQAPKSDVLKTLSVGDVVPGFVAQIRPDHMMVAVSPLVKGKVRKQHISVDPAIASQPGKHFAVGQAVSVKVLAVQANKKILDLRIVDQDEKKSSLSYPLAVDQVKADQLVNGLVTAVDERRQNLTVQLYHGVSGRVHVTHLADVYQDTPTKAFSINQVVQCKVLDVDVALKRIDLTLRASLVQGAAADPASQKAITSVQDVNKDDVIQGYVENVANGGVFISYGPQVQARVKIAQLSDDFVKDWKDLYTVGQLVTSKVLFVDADLKRIEASLKESVVTGKPVEKKKKKDVEQQVPDEESEDEPMQDNTDVSDDDSEGESDAMEIDSDAQNSDDAMEIEQDDDDEEEEEEESDADEPVAALPISNGKAFDWTGQSALLGQDSDSSDADSEDSDDDKPSKKKKKAKQVVEDRTAELSTAAPQSVGDFERLVVGSPDSSYVWINYMAYQLQLSEIEKARAIGERALKTINFREEQEKLNVWVALMNLENQFGSEASLDQVFKRTLKFCEPKKMYLQLVKIYERSEKFDKAEDLWKQTIKKFSQSSKVWTMFGQYYLQQGKPDAARDLLQRSLQSLPKHKHVKTIVKFAQLEFKYGEAERGRTIMEGVMNNSPKRVDLWNVYLDLEIKAGDHGLTQRLFERVTSMKFSSKKMKFLFKKWLQFEKKYGSDDDVDLVKQRTLAYVESLNA